MIAALIVLLGALALAVALPSPLCLVALVPAALGWWLCRESLRGRWER